MELWAGSLGNWSLMARQYEADQEGDEEDEARERTYYGSGEQSSSCQHTSLVSSRTSHQHQPFDSLSGLCHPSPCVPPPGNPLIRGTLCVIRHRYTSERESRQPDMGRNEAIPLGTPAPRGWARPNWIRACHRSCGMGLIVELDSCNRPPLAEDP